MADKTKTFEFDGFKQVMAGIDRSRRDIQRGVSVGLKRSGLFLQRESMKQVPVDLGHLRASAFTRREGNLLNSSIYVGYTAEYAAAVHEMPMKHKGEPRQGYYVDGIRKKGRYWDPQPRGKNKFLEDPMKDAQNRAKMNQIIKDSIVQSVSLGDEGKQELYK